MFQNFILFSSNKFSHKLFKLLAANAERSPEINKDSKYFTGLNIRRGGFLLVMGRYLNLFIPNPIKNVHRQRFEQFFTANNERNNRIRRMWERALGLPPITTNVNGIQQILSHIYSNNDLNQNSCDEFRCCLPTIVIDFTAIRGPSQHCKSDFTSDHNRFQHNSEPARAQVQYFIISRLDYSSCD